MPIERPDREDVLPSVKDAPAAKAPVNKDAEVVGQLADTALNAYRDYAENQIEEAQAKAREAANIFSQKQHELLYDPSSGYFTINGKAAYEQADDVNEQMRQIWEEQAEQLDDLAQSYFRQYTEGEVQQAETNIDAHARAGLDNWQQNEYDLFVQNSISHAVNFGGNIEEFSAFMARKSQEIINWGQAHGWSQEQIQLEIQSFQSSALRSAIIGALARNNLDYAQGLYEANAEMLLSGDQIQVLQELQQAQERAQAASQGEAIYAAVYEVYNPTTDNLAEARVALTARFNGEELASALDTLMGVRQRQLTLRQEASHNAMVELQETLQTSDIRWSQLPSVKPEAWSRLTEDQKQALKGQHINDVIGVWTNYREFRAMPADVKAEIPIDAVYKFYPRDKWDDVIGKIKAARAGTLPSQEEMDIVEGADGNSFDESIMADLKTMFGPKPEEWSALEKQKADTINRMISLRMDEAAGNDNTLSIKEQTELKNRVIGQATTMTGTQGGFYGLGGHPAPELFEFAESATKLNEASETLQKLGIPQTPTNLRIISEKGKGAEFIQRQLEARDLLQMIDVPVTRDRILFYANDGLTEDQKDEIRQDLRNRGFGDVDSSFVTPEVDPTSSVIDPVITRAMIYKAFFLNHYGSQ